MEDEVLLRVADLKVQYERGGRAAGRPAVSDVSFEVGVGKTLGIVGESGSGKSTVASCITGLLRPSSGSVTLGGMPLSELQGRRLREARRVVQMVFQDPYASLNPRMRVRDIVLEPLMAHSSSGRLGRGERERRLTSLLASVGLDPAAADRFPSQFSGGQRQRIAIARALAPQPRLIVCDEAVSALDVSVQAQIINLLKDLQERDSLAFVFISHDLAVVRAIADDVLVLREGAVVERGPCESVLQSPQHPYTRALLEAVPRIPAV